MGRLFEQFERSGSVVGGGLVDGAGQVFDEYRTHPGSLAMELAGTVALGAALAYLNRGKGLLSLAGKVATAGFAVSTVCDVFNPERLGKAGEAMKLAWTADSDKGLELARHRVADSVGKPLIHSSFLNFTMGGTAALGHGLLGRGLGNWNKPTTELPRLLSQHIDIAEKTTPFARFAYPKTLSPADKLKLVKEHSRDVPNLLGKTADGLVQVLSGKGEHASVGTGFVVDAKGIIVTNKHVAAEYGVTSKVQFLDGRQYTARSVWEHHDKDIALLKIVDANGKRFRPLELLDRIDQYDYNKNSLFALGLPFEAKGKQVVHVAPSKFRQIGDGYDKIDAGEVSLITQSGVFPGFSGGPVVDKDGLVVAMTKSQHVLGPKSVLSADISAALKEHEQSGNVWDSFKVDRRLSRTNQLTSRGDQLPFNSFPVGLQFLFSEEGNKVRALAALAEFARHKKDGIAALKVHDHILETYPHLAQDEFILERRAAALADTKRHGAAMSAIGEMIEKDKSEIWWDPDQQQRNALRLAVKYTDYMLKDRTTGYRELSGVKDLQEHARNLDTMLCQLEARDPLSHKAMMLKGDIEMMLSDAAHKKKHKRKVESHLEASFAAYKSALKLAKELPDNRKFAIAEGLYKLSLTIDSMRLEGMRVVNTHPMRRAALNLISKSKGEYSPEQLPVIDTILSTAAFNKLEGSDILRYYDRKVGILERAYGPHSHQVADALANKVHTAFSWQMLAGIDNDISRIAKICEFNLGPNRPRFMDSLNFIRKLTS